MRGDKRVDGMNPAFVILYVRASEIIARSCGTWKFETIIINKEEKVLSLIANMTLTRKKILSIFLSAVLLITMLPVQAASAEDPVETPTLAEGVCFEWVGTWTKNGTREQTSFTTKEGFAATANINSGGGWNWCIKDFSLPV